jgi:hypothetical protein
MPAITLGRAVKNGVRSWAAGDGRIRMIVPNCAATRLHRDAPMLLQSASFKNRQVSGFAENKFAL